MGLETSASVVLLYGTEYFWHPISYVTWRLKVYISYRVLGFQSQSKSCDKMAVKRISVAVIRKFMKIYMLWRTFKCPRGNETFQKMS